MLLDPSVAVAGPGQKFRTLGKRFSAAKWQHPSKLKLHRSPLLIRKLNGKNSPYKDLQQGQTGK